MDTSDLVILEDSLAKSGDHDSNKLKVATAVRAAFKACATDVPSTAAAKAFFHGKGLSAGNSDPGAGSPSNHQLDQQFCTLTRLAILSLCESRQADASGFLAQAQNVAAILNHPLYQNEMRFLKLMNGETAAVKLRIEMCYESINQAFAADANKAFRLIGTGLVLSEQIHDDKRQADFLGKAQFALYELLVPHCPNLALSLGCYLCKMGTQYPAIEAWSHFRDGNVYIDLGGNKKKSKDDAGAGRDYEAAKKYFEATLAWAEKNQLWYGIMMAHERLGVANTRLGAMPIAQKHFDTSLDIAATHQTEIEPVLRNGNLVRCKIGMGNLKFESETGPNRITDYTGAGKAFIEAVNAANRIGDTINGPIAMNCLKELVKTWPDTINTVPGIDDALKLA